MADAYWRGNGSRQPPPALSRHVSKRPRSDYEMPSALDISSFYAHEDEREGHQVFRDTESINASYDRYLRSAQISTYGGESGRSMSGGHGGHHRVEDSRGMAMMGSDPVLAAKSRTMGHHHVEDPRGMSMVGSDPVLASKGRAMGVVGKPEIPLPPDASSTLFVEGLPANCTRREVAHIFRPFVGYKEVRLVTKESRHSGGDPLVLCFVDFQSPAHSATAMDALQGYKFDELERDSNHLRLQFARYPGAKSGGGHRGKR